jgi:hypothetical protein
MGVTEAAPAAAICRTVASSCCGESDRNGTIGPISTAHGSPAAANAAHTPSRRCGLGVPGSRSRHSASSAQPTDTASPTSVTSAAWQISSRSRRISVPLVRIENGLAASRSAVRMPGMSR